MTSLLRSLLIFILVFGLNVAGSAQQVLSLDQVRKLDDHPQHVFYGLSDAQLQDPHPSKIRFRPISAFDNGLAVDHQQALWRKLAIETNDLTDFIIEFKKCDYADIFLFQDGKKVNHLQTGYLLPSPQRQIRSGNIAHLQLESNSQYDLYIRTHNFTGEGPADLTVNTLNEWITKQQSWNLLAVAFYLLLLGAIGYAAYSFARRKTKGFLCQSAVLASTAIYFAYSSGLLREWVFDLNPLNARFFLPTLLLVPFCYYRTMVQVVKVGTEERFEPKTLLKWASYANMALFGLSALLLLNAGFLPVVDKIIRYALLANSAAGAVTIFYSWSMQKGHRKHFLYGSVIMVAGLFLASIFWQSSSLSTLLLIVSALGQLPFSANSLSQLGKLVRPQTHDNYVVELQQNQQMIERQKHDLATQIDELSQKLGGAMQEVEHSAKVKEDFLSIMSHEIRTPLNAIVGLTHLISKEENITEIKRNIGTLERSVDALLGLIDDVLDFNKIYTGQLQLENIDFDLHETVKKIAKTYKRSAAQKDIEFEFNFDPLIPINVGGDAFRLTQVLDNLLGNAIKFTEEGTIRLAASYLNGHQSDKVRVQFEIEDSGIGIAPDDLSKIFDRFQEADTDISRKYGESGLGLSIAKALISMMGCDFTVKSAPGQGSIFAFVLEFERSGPEDKTTKRMEQIEEGVPQGLRILVVDDNEMNRMILNQFLNKWGIESDDAENGKEAFEKVVKNSYDLVLLDLQMPIMDGYELTKLIRSNEMLRDLPIIAISADSISNVYEKVTAAGMNDFIVKPLNPADLKQKIAVYSHNLQMHSIYSR